MIWTREGEISKLWSIIGGKVATVRPLGERWKADVFGPRGQSSFTLDCLSDAREWAVEHWKREVRGR